MKPIPRPTPALVPVEPIDFWRAVAQRGVLALGFRHFEHGELTDMIAELVAPQSGWILRAAHAATEVHKLIAIEPDTAAFAARQALSQELRRGPAVRELAIYQGLLLERLWREVAAAPAVTLQALAYPHED